MDWTRHVTMAALMAASVWGCAGAAPPTTPGPASDRSGVAGAVTLPGARGLRAVDVVRLGAIADSVAHAQLAAGEATGLVIAIGHRGETVLERGYGVADAELDVAMRADHVLKIGSLTKQFTAALIMRLVAEGKVSLDEPLTTWLPDYPVQGRRVTLRHLLTHTSGVADIAPRSAAEAQRLRLDLEYEQLVEWVGTQPVRFEPGDRFDYNNMAYNVLGQIIGRVTGTTYEVQVESMLRELGLEGTLHCDPRRLIPGRASGYDPAPSGVVNTRYVSLSIPGASGSLCSTADDLVRWTQLLHGGQVVSASSLRQMTSPTVLSSGDTVGYGFGLYIDELDGRAKVYHGSTAVGFSSYLAHYPAEALTIAVLTNTSGGRTKAMEAELSLALAAFGSALRDVPLTAADIARYEGTYLLEVGQRTAELRVFGDAGVLKAQLGGGTPTRLLHQGDHVFRPEAGMNVRYVFAVRDGRAERVVQQLSRWEVNELRRRP